CTGRKGPDDYW
nr:immunoglobulin heavy chain junction region [Macaca mulatta]MOW32600.1 immunoglobulin heavy chain junction region [Macaca mulatta]MOW32653.1 immunoglobulin heavy chain junction region [Macaca mulatta]MOW33475.1 immunoglobulin heavy chain junction region [Macaca mulatta]